MNSTVSPAPQSSVKLEIQVEPKQIDEAYLDAVRRLSKRTRVPGFRPGKAPRVMLERVLGPGAVMDEAVEHIVADNYRQALKGTTILPLDSPTIDFEKAPTEGEPWTYTALIQVRPSVKLGDYRNFNFRPEIETTDDEKVAKVLDELRDQNAILEPVEDRAVATGDYVVIAFEGTRNGEPFEGGSSDRMPLVVGNDRLIPGFEDHLIGLKVGDTNDFDITFPDDYQEPTLAGQQAHFHVELKEHRAKVLPELSDEFAKDMGPYDSLDTLRTDIRHRLERNALDKARHEFADRIIEYAVANASFELPESVAGPGVDAQGLPPILVDQETEVMHDEFRSTLARQGISEEAYTNVTGQSHEDLHNEFRPEAEKRVRTLLVLSKVADAEGVTVPDADVEAEVDRARERYGEQKKLMTYFDSERGRNFIRSTLRRSRTVETLIDEWLATHPDHPALPHADDDEQRSVVHTASAESSASVSVTDPASLAEPETAESPSAEDITESTAPEGAAATT
jgi:trigger factor